jgi:hypothetical protein
MTAAFPFPVPPAPGPEPRLAQAVMWVRCWLYLTRRDLIRRTKTLVSASRVRGGLPTRRHLDRMADDRLTYAQRAELARLDDEAVAALPIDLRVELTRNLTTPLTSLTSPGGPSEHR